MGEKSRSNFSNPGYCMVRKYCSRLPATCAKCVRYSEYKRKVKQKGDSENVVEIGKGKNKSVIRRKK